MTSASEQLISVPASLFPALRRVMNAQSADTGPEKLRTIGIELGEAIAAHLAERLSSPDPAAIGTVESDHFWTALHDLFEQLGWGDLEHERLHPGLISLSADDWFEAGSDNGSGPGCHLTVGMLGEIFRQIVHLDLAVLEVQCRSAGDGRCRFLIGSVPAVQSVYQSIESGSPYRQAIAALG